MVFGSALGSVDWMASEALPILHGSKEFHREQHPGRNRLQPTAEVLSLQGKALHRGDGKTGRAKRTKG